MTMTDPIADMLTRIRNAVRIQRDDVEIPASGLKRSIADVLKREGFIQDYEVHPGNVQGVLQLTLKYGEEGEALITTIKRESKPGRRLYCGVADVERVLNGTGIGIYSTSQGVLSDRECRDRGIGGERLATVW